MSTDKDIFTKEIESWAGFGYALRKENRSLFEETLDRCKKKEYVDCAVAKGESFSAEVLFLVLIFEQQKGLRKIGTTNTLLILSLSSVFLAAIFLHERISIFQIIAVGIMIFGIYLIKQFNIQDSTMIHVETKGRL
jgi:hypothetical protein